jgi:hypothetical protein
MALKDFDGDAEDGEKTPLVQFDIGRSAKSLNIVGTVKAEMDRYDREQREVQHVADLPAIRSLWERQDRERAMREESLDLLRRSTIASEQAIADAQRREEEAKAGERRAHRWAILGWLGTLAGLLLAAWPYIKDSLEAL